MKWVVREQVYGFTGIACEIVAWHSQHKRHWDGFRVGTEGNHDGSKGNMQ